MSQMSVFTFKRMLHDSKPSSPQFGVRAPEKSSEALYQTSAQSNPFRRSKFVIANKFLKKPRSMLEDGRSMAHSNARNPNTINELKNSFNGALKTTLLTSISKVKSCKPWNMFATSRNKSISPASSCFGISRFRGSKFFRNCLPSAQTSNLVVNNCKETQSLPKPPVETINGSGKSTLKVTYLVSIEFTAILASENIFAEMTSSSLEIILTSIL